MYRYISLFLLLCCTSFSAVAQSANTNTLPPLLFKGKISFERKTNMHKQLDDMMKGRAGGMVDQMKKNSPKYKVDRFDLFFTDTKSLYKPAPDGISESKMMMGNIPAERNIVFNDYEKQTQIAEKKLFEKSYLIQDSFRKHNWKITEEFRKIAGYNCRRAETIILDSIYVIAFYTDAIIAPGGPESFNGLPGMILGIVLPRLNMTYFATDIQLFLPNEKEIVPPTKGEKKSIPDIDKTLRNSMSQWGSFVDRILWYIVI